MGGRFLILKLEYFVKVIWEREEGRRGGNWQQGRIRILSFGGREGIITTLSELLLMERKERLKSEDNWLGLIK